MLSIGNKWDKKDDVETKIVEYRKMDFYGPFLTLYLEKNKDDAIKVIPVSCRIETAQISESSFTILSNASRELYQRLGKFILKTNLFSVVIDSEDTETILLKELKELPLF